MTSLECTTFCACESGSVGEEWEEQVSRENLWVGTPCSLNCGLDASQLKGRCHNAVDFRSKKKHHFRLYKLVSIKGSAHQTNCCLPTPVACPVCSSGSCISDQEEGAKVLDTFMEITHNVQVYLFLLLFLPL